MRGNATSDPAAIVPAVAPTPRSSRPSIFTSTFAIAACFLVAFGLGLALRGGLPGAGNDQMATPAAAPADAVAQVELQDTSQDAATAAEDTPPTSPENATAAAEPDVWSMIRLVETNDSEPAGAAGRESIIPPHIRRTLERMGHRVEEHREMLPIQLDDGTQGYIPAERVELHYVGSQYQ